MQTLKEWLEYKYLEWQAEHGRLSLKKWSDMLGVKYSYLMNMISGENLSTSMQVAYQIGERLSDFSILEVLGYPVPDAPLVGFSDEQRALVLAFLEKVKVTLEGLPPDEQDAKLKEILAADGWTESLS
jgi:hypothetical protein